MFSYKPNHLGWVCPWDPNTTNKNNLFLSIGTPENETYLNSLLAQDKNSYIGNVNGVMNAVITQGKPVGESILQGEGAGPGPTSSALLSDLISILRGNLSNPFGISYNKLWVLNKNDDYKISQVGEIPLVTGGISEKIIHQKIHK